MKILVTGTAGFIGFHLVNALCARGDTVIGLDNINDYYDQRVKYGRLKHAGIIDDLEAGDALPENTLIRSKKHPNYQFIKLDLTDNANLEILFKTQQFEAVMNLAAQAGVRYSLTNPRAYIDANITGFVNLLENARHYQVENFAYASSSSVYGLNTSLPFATSDHTNHPISLYAASKKSNELMAHTYSHLFGLRTTGLRFFTVYGPWGRPDMALFLFTKAALENQPINVFNEGKMQRDFTYIDDAVAGIIQTLNHPATADTTWHNHAVPNPATSSAPYAIYNIGNNAPTQLTDYIKAIERKLGIAIKQHKLPLQPGDVPAAFANIDATIKTLNYQPQTSVQTGVNQFIDWYRAFFNV